MWLHFLNKIVWPICMHAACVDFAYNPTLLISNLQNIVIALLNVFEWLMQLSQFSIRYMYVVIDALLHFIFTFFWSSIHHKWKSTVSMNNSTALVLILPLAWNICRKSTVIHAYVDFNVDHLGSVQRKRIKSSLFAREVGRILRWGRGDGSL